MIKLLCNGGCGDACMVYAKLFSKDCPFTLDQQYTLHHTEVHRTLLPAISSFYRTQHINAYVDKIDNWQQYLKLYRKDYTYLLDTSWQGINEAEPCWEINPKAPLIYEKQQDIEVLVAPFAGRDATRTFTFDDIKALHAKHGKRVHYIGKGNTTTTNVIQSIVGDLSLINITSMQELVNLICSCDVLVGHSGFCVFLAGLAQKKVYCVSEGRPTQIRVHPSWNVQYIKTLNEVVL